MMASMSVEERLEGAMNFNSWKSRVMNLLEENDLDGYMTSVVAEPSDDAWKTAYKKNQAKEKSYFLFYKRPFDVGYLSIEDYKGML